MQFDSGFIATVSGHDLVYFSITLFILVLNYWAVARIIRKAGYSSAWLVVPLTPLVITVAFLVIAYNDLYALVHGVPIGFFGSNSLVLLLRLDELSALVLWLFFLIFAFSKWPMSDGRMAPKDPGQRPPPSSASPRGTGGDRSTSPRSNPTSLASPPAGGAGTLRDRDGGRGAARPSVAVGPRKAIFCGWCGETTPGIRALSHDCGSKDRPLAFCRFCGKLVAAGSDSCSECFA